MQLNAAGQVEFKLKTPRRDGTTQLEMSPLEFMQRLAALVPRPRLHLIRFHGAWGAGAERQVAGAGSAAGVTQGRGSGERCRRRLVRGRYRPSPAATHQLGAAAQARVRHRHSPRAALPPCGRGGAARRADTTQSTAASSPRPRPRPRPEPALLIGQGPTKSVRRYRASPNTNHSRPPQAWPEPVLGAVEGAKNSYAPSAVPTARVLSGGGSSPRRRR